MLKLISLDEAAAQFCASCSTCLNEPGPLSAVVVTVATIGPGAVPVTVSGSAVGVAALAGTVTTRTESVSTPSAFGVAVISKVQDAASASDGAIRHWLEPSTLNPEPPPLKETLLIDNVDPDVLVNVACIEGETTPVVLVPKLRPAGGA